jgi:hypothetical protein
MNILQGIRRGATILRQLRQGADPRRHICIPRRPGAIICRKTTRASTLREEIEVGSSVKAFGKESGLLAATLTTSITGWVVTFRVEVNMQSRIGLSLLAVPYG